VIYSCNKSQQDALFLNFILVNNSTCFGQTYCPSSGVLKLYSQQLVFVVLVMWLSASEVVKRRSHKICFNWQGAIQSPIPQPGRQSHSPIANPTAHSLVANPTAQSPIPQPSRQSHWAIPWQRPGDKLRNPYDTLSAEKGDDLDSLRSSSYPYNKKKLSNDANSSFMTSML